MTDEVYTIRVVGRLPASNGVVYLRPGEKAFRMETVKNELPGWYCIHCGSRNLDLNEKCCQCGKHPWSE